MKFSIKIGLYTENLYLLMMLISKKITLFSPEIQYQLLSVHLKEIWSAALWEAQRIPLHYRFVENATV